MCNALWTFSRQAPWRRLDWSWVLLGINSRWVNRMGGRPYSGRECFGEKLSVPVGVEWSTGVCTCKTKIEQLDRSQIVLATQGAFIQLFHVQPFTRLLTSNGRTRARLTSIYGLNTDQQWCLLGWSITSFFLNFFKNTFIYFIHHFK